MPKPTQQYRWIVAGSALAAIVIVAIAIGIFKGTTSPPPVREAPLTSEPPAQISNPTEFARIQRQLHPRAEVRGALTSWWDAVPPRVQEATVAYASQPNIHPTDYAGPDSCRKCHPKNYESWSQHSHRWMNAEANDTTVKGDFSGTMISYLGGEATFFRLDDQYRMRLVRGNVRHEYVISQTIGSRFFQYYVGRAVKDEVGQPQFESADYVLPFGYWLEPGEWVPAVHIVEEQPDGQRADPFVPRPAHHDYQYSQSCNYCHTTFPLADMLVRHTELMGSYAPYRLHWFVSEYLASQRPQLFSEHSHPSDLSDQEVNQLINTTKHFAAATDAITLGISCEACHLGSKEHAEGRKKLPDFFPRSPHLHVDTQGQELNFGRTHTNVNWACARCHVGSRPEYAAGMGTWNSTEFSDAVKGACYSQLTCIHCHDPHKSIGPQWPATADQDDQLCLKCHQTYEPPEARLAHTHHAPGSSGSHCMDCHMPRINEGMQDVVRTHAIFSPTQPDMIESNHPNACNLCHTDQSINWTLDHLTEWYGRSYSETKLTANYPQRQASAAIGWLNSKNEAVRLVAADALFRHNDRWAATHLLNALDDSFLLNRQFARKGVERLFELDLAAHGYQFYMSPSERQAPLAKIREMIQADDVSSSPTAKPVAANNDPEDVGR